MSAILSEIVDTVRLKFGVLIEEAIPVRRGYLNEKWTLRTNRGTWFAKCYSPLRYQHQLKTIWQEIERALDLQMVYYRQGGACPRAFENEHGGWLHETADGRKFVLMTCCPGDNIASGQVSERQMYALGAAAARMHDVWNTDAGTPAVPPPDSPPLWEVHVNEIMNIWQDRWEKCGETSPEVRQSLLLQKEVLDRFDPAALAHCRPGWSHLDLWTENLLLEPDRLAAIVDFDRVRYSYPYLDLGRAILSCVLRDGEFRRDAVAAFADGYRTVLPLPRNALLHAVRHCWLIESCWWIRPSAASWSTAPRRFRQEMIWTASQWDNLEKRLSL